MRPKDPQKDLQQMSGELTKKLLQIVTENVALKKQVRRLQGQIKFLKQHCDCPPPPPPPLLAALSHFRIDRIDRIHRIC